MTIISYIFKLIASFFFGASIMCLILERIFAYQEGYYCKDDFMRIVKIFGFLIVIVVSGVCLWIIK